MEHAGKVRKDSVVRGVAVLAVAGILVKIIGVFYKIPLTYLIGDEGMGYFNAAYTIYAWLYMLATAGFPIAISILISEARAENDAVRIRKIARLSGLILAGLGAVTTAIMLLFSSSIAALIGSPGAAYSMAAIAPTLFFVALSSYYRGYFQGFERMGPTAVSQLIEAAGKLLLGMLLARFANEKGLPLPTVSAYAIFGVTAGTVLGALYLAIRYAFFVKIPESVEAPVIRKEEGTRHLLGHLVAVALPITVSASVMSLTGLVDLGMMIRRLVSIGYSRPEATAVYGNYTTLVVPMLNLPSVLITPLATGIVPALSRARADGDRPEMKRIMDGAFRAAAIFAVPAALGMCLFAKPVLLVLYPAESVAAAYRLLAVISPSVYFVCVLTVTNASLQACGHTRAPMVAMIVGGALKTAVGYVLLGTEGIGILGAPIGTVVCYGVAHILCIYYLFRTMRYLPPAKELLLRPLLAAAPAVGVSAYVYRRFFISLPTRGGALAGIVLAAVLYLLLSLAFGVVRTEDLRVFLRKGKGREAREN